MRVLLAVVVASLLTSPGAATQQDAHRDEWQRVADVLSILGAEAGARVADIGAGGGYFTHHLRRAVGTGGRVYAVDIVRVQVEQLRDELDGMGVRNVEVVLGEPDDPRLPFRALDGALIVNAYHEMTEYPIMLAAIRDALEPGGRLVILDNPPPASLADRAAQTARHQIHIDLVAGELEAASFEVVERDARFISATADGHDHRMWLLAARRPLRDPQPVHLSGAPAGPEGRYACMFGDTGEPLTERLSPPDSVEATLGTGRVKVCYSRPSMRGRSIMGNLVPLGTPWRTGANEATALRTDVPIRVGDASLEPGWYSLYTVPRPERWDVVVNGVADREGLVLDDWVRSRDVGSTSVPTEPTLSPVESLTMRFEPQTPDSVELVIEWERTRVRVPIARAR